MRSSIGKIVAVLGVLTVFVSAAPCAVAQSPDVEVNNSALEHYVPPPMFGAPEKPSLSRPLDNNWVPSLTVDDARRNSSGTADIKAEDVLDAPVPGHKPVDAQGAFSASRVRTEFPGSISVPPRRAVKLPPLPPRRPNVMSASPAYTGRFIQKPNQVDVPAMPAVPAGKVEAEVLYRAPKKNGVGEASANAAAPAAKSQAEPLTLTFALGQDELSGEQELTLLTQVVPVLRKDDGTRVLIAAFAAPADDSASSARRVSLNRALSVRTALIGRGVTPERIDVRANGSDTQMKPIDRVDLVLIRPQP